MRKVTNYLMMFMMAATVLFVTSCGEDVENPIGDNATITGLEIDGVDTTGVNAEPGENVTVSVAYDLDEATGITLNGFVGDSAVFSALPLSSSSTNPIQTSFTVPATATEDFTVTYELRNSDGTTADSEAFNVTVDIPVDATVYEAVLLATPLGQNPGERTSGTFFSATDGKTYSVDNVVAGTDISSADIQFGYYYGATNRASIASPAEYPTDVYDLGPTGANWGTLNETKFRPIDSDNFDEATRSAEVAAQFEIAGSGNESGEINGLAVGDTYAFSYTEGEDTRFGIFRVTELEEGIESNDFITLSVKVETTDE